jgi:hypothetical protein
MNKYTVMGSTPGDGAVVEGENCLDAFANFCVNESNKQVTKEEVLKKINCEMNDLKEITLGDYEIKQL